MESSGLWYWRLVGLSLCICRIWVTKQSAIIIWVCETHFRNIWFSMYYDLIWTRAKEYESIQDELTNIFIIWANTMSKNMINTQRKHCCEKYYHSVEETFGISQECLTEWISLNQDLSQNMITCVKWYDNCWEIYTHSHIFCCRWRTRERERERERERACLCASFYMLYWSCHLVATGRTIWKAKGVVFTRFV